MRLINKNISGNNFAKSGIETALLDAHAKRLNVRVSDLFGGAISNQLPVLWTLASGDTEKDIEEAKHLISINRHNVFKLNIGRKDPQIDVDHVSALKNDYGKIIIVIVDINHA